MTYKITIDESEKIALLSALIGREEIIKKEILSATEELNSDNSPDGETYWVDKLKGCSTDLSVTITLMNKIKTTPIHEIPNFDEE